MLFIKDGIVKLQNKISIVIDNNRIFNPTKEMLLDNGWEIYTPPTQEPIEIPIEEQYKQLVVELIRERYSIDDELAILRQRDSKIDEFNTYNSFVEECKQQAREELGL